MAIYKRESISIRNTSPATEFLLLLWQHLAAYHFDIQKATGIVLLFYPSFPVTNNAAIMPVVFSSSWMTFIIRDKPDAFS